MKLPYLALALVAGAGSYPAGSNGSGSDQEGMQPTPTQAPAKLLKGLVIATAGGALGNLISDALSDPVSDAIEAVSDAIEDTFKGAGVVVNGSLAMLPLIAYFW